MRAFALLASICTLWTFLELLFVNYGPRDTLGSNSFTDPTWSGNNNLQQASRLPGIVVEMVVVIPTQWLGEGVQLIGDLVLHSDIEREIAYKKYKHKRERKEERLVEGVVVRVVPWPALTK